MKLNEYILLCTFIILLVMAGCGPSAETARVEHRRCRPDQGRIVCARAAMVDRPAGRQRGGVLSPVGGDGFVLQQPLRDLAQMHYERAMLEPDKSRKRTELLRASRAQLSVWRRVATRRPTSMNALCELSSSLGDDRTFLVYAKKNAEQYPYDRQVFNLTRAYYDVEDYQGVIRTAKDAVEKYKESPYVGSFYRILGKAYTKIDRDQTAERILVAGLKATDARIAVAKSGGGEYRSTDVYRRLHEDKVQMLLILKQLHTTYKAQDKLDQVERQLKEEGYGR